MQNPKRLSLRNSGRTSSRFSKNRGHVLVFVAMIMFGIFAMAALVIDVGFARLTQRQMQTAVDSAAIEALRFLDDPEFPQSERDSKRRELAGLIVAQTFDDDLLSSVEDPTHYGAGPIVEFTNATGDPAMNASSLVQIGEPPVYKPLNSDGSPGLNPNLDNRIDGDMLAGDYLGDQSHHEADDYSRDDFVDGDSAMLVRMRRTIETEREGISTAGPLPFLFARGSLVNRAMIGAGLSVRATAIADLRPVVCVGRGNATMIGRSACAVSIEDWIAPKEYPDIFRANRGVVGEAVGSLLKAPSESVSYIAIFSKAVNNRVIGFGCASITEGRLVKQFSDDKDRQLASRNGSAVFCLPVDVTTEQLRAILLERRSILETHPNAFLLAPVSVR